MTMIVLLTSDCGLSKTSIQAEIPTGFQQLTRMNFQEHLT